jgi:hypothetical protein
MPLPTDSAERKKWPMYTGLLKYFPDALAALAHHSWESNEKHNPGEPVHWSKGKSDDHRDCIVRHLTDAIAAEEEYGQLSNEVEYELKAMAWRANAELQSFYDKRKVRDIPKVGDDPKTIAILQPASKFPIGVR